MNSEQLYQQLVELAEKLDITVSEQNLRKSGVHVRSGLCKIKGQNVFILDKHKSIRRKVAILAEALAKIPHEDIFMVPAVRELLEKYADDRQIK